MNDSLAHSLRRLSALVPALLWFTAPLSAQPSRATAVLDFFGASSAQGVAPLLVHFSPDLAAPGADPLAFHVLDYTWDFGDPSSGLWGTTSLPKNSAKGPVAAHVFDNPGTYRVRLTVRDSSGASGVRDFTVTVQDPDRVYAGMRTTCVNPIGDSDFDGAPPGARLVATDDLSSVIEFASPGSRLLFKRGASWTTKGIEDWTIARGPVTIGAYGRGVNPDAFGIFQNAPKITVVTGDFLPLDRKGDLRVMDLNLENPARNAGFTTGATDFSRILLYRLKVTGFGTGIGWSHWNNPDGRTQIDAMGIVSCDVSDSDSNVAYIGGERLTVLGNRFRNARQSHVVRVWQAYRAVIGGNLVSGSSLDSDTGRQALKLHGPDEKEVSSKGWDRLVRRTEFTVVSDNLFGSSGPWPVSLGPQNDASDERLSNIIFERNRYAGEYGQRSGASLPLDTAFLFCGRQLTVRNNVIDASNYGKYFTGILVRSSAAAPAPKDVWIYHNTVYKTGSSRGESWAAVSVERGAEGVTVRNNLAVFPAGAEGNVAVLDRGKGTVQGGNLLNGQVSFVNPDDRDPLARSFALKAGSASAIDAGVRLDSAYEDYSGKPRAFGSGFDIGAHEYRVP